MSSFCVYASKSAVFFLSFLRRRLGRRWRHLPLLLLLLFFSFPIVAFKKDICCNLAAPWPAPSALFYGNFCSVSFVRRRLVGVVVVFFFFFFSPSICGGAPSAATLGRRLRRHVSLHSLAKERKKERRKERKKERKKEGRKKAARKTNTFSRNWRTEKWTKINRADLLVDSASQLAFYYGGVRTKVVGMISEMNLQTVSSTGKFI